MPKTAYGLNPFDSAFVTYPGLKSHSLVVINEPTLLPFRGESRETDMTLVEFLLFVFFGGLVGFLAGLLGIGGGGVLVPLLVFSYKHSGISPTISTHLAISTSLFVIFFASLTSAYQHNKQHNIHWQAALVLGFSSALTAFAASGLAVKLSGKLLRVIFALLSIVIAGRMVSEGSLRSEKRLESPSTLSTIHLVGIGLCAGAVSALAGVGGGGITIPLMYYLLNLPLKLAIGTSSATIVITAFFSVVGYIFHGAGHPDLPKWSIGLVDFQRGGALVIGSFLMARIGAYISFRTPPDYLRRLFALFIILISI